MELVNAFSSASQSLQSTILALLPALWQLFALLAGVTLALALIKYVLNKI